MKQWFYKVFTLTVVGMVVYLIFSKDDSLYYHFPWELFAGIGMMSWAVQEGLKMIKAVKKEMEQWKKREWPWIVFVIIPAVQAWLKGEYHEHH